MIKFQTFAPVVLVTILIFGWMAIFQPHLCDLQDKPFAERPARQVTNSAKMPNDKLGAIRRVEDLSEGETAYIWHYDLIVTSSRKCYIRPNSMVYDNLSGFASVKVTKTDIGLQVDITCSDVQWNVNTEIPDSALPVHLLISH